jgi:hypothetical protein
LIAPRADAKEGAAHGVGNAPANLRIGNAQIGFRFQVLKSPGVQWGIVRDQ